MALRAGRNVSIFINGTDLTGDLNSINPTSMQDLPDATVFGNIGHTSFPGLSNDEGTIEGLYNSTGATVFQAMIQLNPSYGMMIPFGTTLGDPVYSVEEAMYKGFNIKSVVTDINRISFSFDTDYHPFEKGVMLTTGKQTVTATGQGTQVDNTTSTDLGGAGYLQVFSVSTGTLAVTVQTSSTGAWGAETITTCTFAVVSTGNTSAQRVAFTAGTYRYARAAYVCSSTSVFALAFTRY